MCESLKGSRAKRPVRSSADFDTKCSTPVPVGDLTASLHDDARRCEPQRQDARAASWAAAAAGGGRIALHQLEPPVADGSTRDGAAAPVDVVGHCEAGQRDRGRSRLPVAARRGRRGRRPGGRSQCQQACVPRAALQRQPCPRHFIPCALRRQARRRTPDDNSARSARRFNEELSERPRRDAGLEPHS